MRPCRWAQSRSAAISMTASSKAGRTGSNCSTAIPIRATRLPPPPVWRRLICISPKAFSKTPRRLHGYWQDAVHSLKGKRHIIDIRNMGIVAAIELRSRMPEASASAGCSCSTNASTTACWSAQPATSSRLSPPLILEKAHIDEMVGRIGGVGGDRRLKRQHDLAHMALGQECFLRRDNVCQRIGRRDKRLDFAAFDVSD